ncbi:SDR family oxidoreductase [Streptomyces sp. NA02950]|uniref:SDR family NAD(P)-dependent oxidoreductase n=1 Tax=Streptomyces sp. NA02950 TaxID=2742137 RepID=UPI00159114C6|nr:SDR family oxidoreductase [Streptomyces sp. NA02950]QKV90696.1 SDR family oxidoreductase [Streptomyces sp. NA02950]
MKILITGTRKGVGRTLAEHFLGAGHTVIGCSRRGSPVEHPRYEHHEVDVTESDQVRGMFRAVKRSHGYLDALVANAGTSTMNHFMLVPEDLTRRIFDVNVFAVLGCCREAAKLMRHSPGSTTAILAVSTVAVPWALEGQLAYSASKAAVEQVVRVMSKELADHRIRINGIGLPPVDTGLARSVPAEKLRALVDRQTIKRPCTVADIVGPVEFLLGPGSAFVTGETLFLGGVN